MNSQQTFNIERELTPNLDYVILLENKIKELAKRPQTLAVRKAMHQFRVFLEEAVKFQTPQSELLKYKKEAQLFNLKLHLKECGSLAHKKWYCKECEADGMSPNEAFLREDKIYQECGIRYCKRHKCILTRFAIQLESLKGIKRLQNLRMLEHFVIGFETIYLEDFISNFAELKKQQERVLNSYFLKLRKKGFKVQAFKVLDFTSSKVKQFKLKILRDELNTFQGEKIIYWTTENEAFKKLIRFDYKNLGIVERTKVYMHYHIIAIPGKSNLKRSFMITSQQIRKDILKRQRVKIPFHIQFFGLKKKENLFSYLTLRAVGLYKFDDAKEKNYKINSIRKLTDLLKQKKFMYLQDIMSVEDYHKNFYNHRHFTTIGGLPYGSIIMDNVLSKFPNFCKIHGTLTRNQVRMEIIPEVIPPPPPPSLNYPKIETLCLNNGSKKEFDNYLNNKVKENQQAQTSKKFNRWCNHNDNKKIELDLMDKLNLISKGKC